MSSVDLESWDKEHFNMLETVAPESFTVKHYVSIAELVKRLDVDSDDSYEDIHNPCLRFQR